MRHSNMQKVFFFFIFFLWVCFWISSGSNCWHSEPRHMQNQCIAMAVIYFLLNKPYTHWKLCILYNTIQIFIRLGKHVVLRCAEAMTEQFDLSLAKSVMESKHLFLFLRLATWLHGGNSATLRVTIGYLWLLHCKTVSWVLVGSFFKTRVTHILSMFLYQI